MINTVKNIIFITFLLGAGFIVLAIGWGGAPFNTAGSAVSDGASALGEAAQGVHDLINNVSESITAVSDSMQRAGKALWRPVEKLSELFGASENASAEQEPAREPAAPPPDEAIASTSTPAPSSDTIQQDD